MAGRRADQTPAQLHVMQRKHEAHFQIDSTPPCVWHPPHMPELTDPVIQNGEAASEPDHARQEGRSESK